MDANALQPGEYVIANRASKTVLDVDDGKGQFRHHSGRSTGHGFESRLSSGRLPLYDASITDSECQSWTPFLLSEIVLVDP